LLVEVLRTLHLTRSNTDPSVLVKKSIARSVVSIESDAEQTVVNLYTLVKQEICETGAFLDEHVLWEVGLCEVRKSYLEHIALLSLCVGKSNS
jgi:hypothetical protein